MHEILLPCLNKETFYVFCLESVASVIFKMDYISLGMSAQLLSYVMPIFVTIA